MILRDSEYDQTTLHKHDGNGVCPQCIADHAARHPALLQFKKNELEQKLAEAEEIIRKQNNDLMMLRVRNRQLESFIKTFSEQLDNLNTLR